MSADLEIRQFQLPEIPMSADLEFMQFQLPEIRLKPIKVRSFQTTKKSKKDHLADHYHHQFTSTGSSSNINSSDGGEECVTPTAEEHKIPETRTCPPAPVKPKRVIPCKRKLSELKFFEILNRDEVESFFQSTTTADPSRVRPARRIKKKQQQQC